MNNRVECLQKNKPRREKEREQRKKWNTNKKGEMQDNFVYDIEKWVLIETEVYHRYEKY